MTFQPAFAQKSVTRPQHRVFAAEFEQAAESGAFTLHGNQGKSRHRPGVG